MIQRKNELLAVSSTPEKDLTKVHTEETHTISSTADPYIPQIFLINYPRGTLSYKDALGTKLETIKEETSINFRFKSWIPKSRKGPRMRHFICHYCERLRNIRPYCYKMFEDIRQGKIVQVNRRAIIKQKWIPKGIKIRKWNP